MIRNLLERRRDPRKPARIPILLKIEDEIDSTPAQLIDLSTGGAALLTTTRNAPEIGQHIELQFQMPGNNEDGESPEFRRETAIVVNTASPERGIMRLGVRFIQCRELGADAYDPLDTLSNHRRSQPRGTFSDRWDAARNFDVLRKGRDRKPVGTW